MEMRKNIIKFPLSSVFTTTLALSAISCTQPAVQAGDRLVDGGALPSASTLSREKIEINRGFGGEGFGEHFLSFELASDNSLVVTHSFRPDDEVIGREAFVLSPDVAMRARKQLWRVRPTKLEGVETDVMPSGCERREVHDFPEIAVGFAASDENYRSFSLPRSASCNNLAAKAARRMLDDILSSFPRSDVAESFVKKRVLIE